ncbi:MAG: hypothetical protein A2X08_05565 [Bacteroidetes bacterium GWA2_32_17]|nr:MAG: hypothetical protein A2X08_05565 [Bacteroidetes bacterium GWA2_32_17]
MTKEEHISYWIKNADRDWKRMQLCFKSKDYVFCLFCIHLSLEKLCKAIWVKYHKTDFPPRIHNLKYILEKTPVILSEDDWIFLLFINKFNLEGRYPDYADKIYKICNKKLTQDTINKAKNIRLCLQKNLQ